MDVDDDDFMGEIEFDLSPEQGAIVTRAVTLASTSESEEFGTVNPLIAIMQWWEVNRAEGDLVSGSPEGTLVEACRRYIAAHERP
jgi:hypothetical protein